MLGSSVGPYQILERLGSGGMGEVFLGHDPRLERRVALKCLTSAASLTPEGHTRVLREARAVARLTHPHIASVYDVLEQDGRAFIVMEYVEGISLAAHLASGPLPAAEVRLIGRQLASALAAAHAHGVIHRDLKPANIQVMRDGSIKVLDFGVAKLIPSLSAVVDTTMGEAMPSLGGNPGTTVYMAPEQLIGHVADARSDIYSAGVILFQMATGRRPYLETTAVTLALAMNADPAPSARELNPLVPLELSEAIGKALKRSPDHRYQSARELDSALAAMSGTSSSTGALNTLDRHGGGGGAAAASTRYRWALAAAAVAILATGVVVRQPLVARLGFGAAAARPVGLAILPVDNPTGDAQTANLAAAISSVVARNFRSVGSIAVVPMADTTPFRIHRADYSSMKGQFGEAYVLDLTVKRGLPRPDVLVRLQRSDGSDAVWRSSLSGTPTQVEDELLAGMTRALSGGWRGDVRFTDAERARIVRLPTRSDAALSAVVEARVLLDRADVPENVVRAIERLQQAVDADRSFAEAHAALGAALLTRYEKSRDRTLIDRATNAVANALALDPDLSAAHYASAHLQYLTGLREAAVASLRRAIALDPDNDAAHRLLGWRLFSNQNRMDAAVAELREAVRIRPDSFENHYRLGTVLYLAGRYREAVDAYRRATEIQPARGDAYTNLGAAYHMAGDIGQAVGNYEHAVGIGVGDAVAYGNLAVSYYFAARYENALAAGLEAAKRDPKRASFQRDLGDYYRALRRRADSRDAYERAIVLARQTLAVNPRDENAVMVMALCETHLGRRAAAEGHVAEALALAPDDRDILFRSAKAYLYLGDRKASLERLRLAVERGYPPELARADPELSTLKPLPELELSIAAGLRARAPASDVR